MVVSSAMVVPPESARRRFGNEMRRHREQAGISQKQLARAVLMSQSMISGLELGQKSTRRDHVARIDDALNTNGLLMRRWESLNSYNGFPDWFKDVVTLERGATEIWEYQPLLVPGILQTKSYAKTIIRLGRPADTEQEIDHQVKARIDRQTILTSERSPLLMSVIDETVLRRPIGGCETMKSQLDHLLKVASWPRATVQVIPMTTEYHPGLDGGFQLLTVPDKGRVLYIETRISGTPVDEPESVDDFVGLYGDLRGIALPPNESRKLMETIRSEYDA